MLISPERVAFNLGYLSKSEIKTLLASGNTVSSEALTPSIEGKGLYTNKTVLHKMPKRKGGVMTAA